MPSSCACAEAFGPVLQCLFPSRAGSREPCPDSAMAVPFQKMVVLPSRSVATMPPTLLTADRPSTGGFVPGSTLERRRSAEARRREGRGREGRGWDEGEGGNGGGREIIREEEREGRREGGRVEGWEGGGREGWREGGWRDSCPSAEPGIEPNSSGPGRRIRYRSGPLKYFRSGTGWATQPWDLRECSAVWRTTRAAFVAISAARASTARTGEPVDMNLPSIETAIMGSHHGDKGRDATI